MGTMGTTAAPWVLLCMTALYHWTAKLAAAKVYYSCGAVIDTQERGLILSPGFPNSYYPNTHCIWQFFVPAEVRLILEILDFDVFESPTEHGRLPDRHISTLQRQSKTVLSAEEKSNGELLGLGFTSKVPLQEGSLKEHNNQSSLSPKSKALDDSYSDFPITTSKKVEAKQVVQQEQSTHLDLAKGTNAMGQSVSHVSIAQSSLVENGDPLTQNVSKSNVDKDPRIAYLTAGRGDNDGTEGKIEDATPASDPTHSSPTQPPSLDVCPHDVLYISDLITFSSRFCGTNLPINRTLIFGSSVEMIEVIMELITTTGYGRGFLILFEYKNETEVNFIGVVKPRTGENATLLAIIAGVVLFAMVLMTALCLAYRHRLCPKRSDSSPSNNQENGIRNWAVDINELQLVVPGRRSQEVTAETGTGCSVSLNPAEKSTGGNGDTSQQTDPDVPSSMSVVTESGSDEVFVISAGTGSSGLSFTSFKIKNDSNLKRNMISPTAVSDWLMVNHMIPETEGPLASVEADKEQELPRPRTWSVRTFHELMAPLPQPQRRWWSWSNQSAFTKLVDNVVLNPDGV
ncbi:uncharacterized protein SI:DKEY-112E17.1 isoform X2 [Latimeria chalumnae]|uniref:uncharacterized protein SI:DKEY-112E17.1 isoform X2 n=1 Tax=Latimeria chalumnae TaxID=7897 RepID=UPI00313E561B